ncbi:MAG: hypothetical protein ABSG68_12515 [Thermoguttaceae bacterium]
MAGSQDWLKLELGEADKPVNADAYAAVFINAIEALKAINRHLSSHGAETIQWEVVGAGSSSPIYAMIRGRDQTANGQYGQQVVDTFTRGVTHLNDSNTCPEFFDRRSLAAITKMRDGAAPYGLQPVFSTPRATGVRVTPSVGVNAAFAMRSLRSRKNLFCEHGSLEGYLRDLSGAADRDKAVIIDPHTNHETPCNLNPDNLVELEKQVRVAWKHRVVVIGTITVDRRTRRPTHVVADDIRILRDRSELPQMDDLHGINITEGVESSEYIRGLRDAE